ncbi:hypothetical protein E6O51_03165 [Pseudothauera rhizosphaerae]|uniref:Uncharacterized protein n=2 Tax=Pseudothauera rhizosphaerae TaxID=2565932 RepID=A0A4S4B0S3_9RHOO|nr:hypothetical protein E6O51_03165 [Pseudothauera rhizosphaerae]
MSGEAVAKVRRLERITSAMPQVEIDTRHLFHAGMYARTIHIPAGVCLTGALIKRATLLIFSGRATVFAGGEVIDLIGYHVIPASAHRKQVFLAHEDTDLTMIFPTEAGTVEAAEAEFTDEAELLLSRRQGGNTTGESQCLEQ